MQIDSKDILFMQRALELAKRGEGRVHPNPMVGAVLVKNGRVIGEGFHQKFGGPHAEVNAIRRASASAEGATLYLSLEPCGHFGKTPPCVDLIIRSKIREVVIAAIDPNPLVSGRGVHALKRAGIKVRAGILREEARRLNKVFNRWIVKKFPYVTIKIAQSLDGKIAASSGQSRWITDEPARRFSHELRASNDAVLVGVNTILKDDPRLSVRLGRKDLKQPVKIILDSLLRTPGNARIFSNVSRKNIWIITTKRAPAKRFSVFKTKADVWMAPAKHGKVDMVWLMRHLALRGISRVLVEGGSEVIADILKNKLAQEFYVFVAPKIIGGHDTKSFVGGKGVDRLQDALPCRFTEFRFIGKDLLIHGDIHG